MRERGMMQSRIMRRTKLLRVGYTRHDTQRTLFLPSFCPPVESHSESNHRTAIIVQRPRDNLYNIGRLT